MKNIIEKLLSKLKLTPVNEITIKLGEPDPSVLPLANEDEVKYMLG